MIANFLRFTEGHEIDSEYSKNPTTRNASATEQPKRTSTNIIRTASAGAMTKRVAQDMNPQIIPTITNTNTC